MGLMGARLCAGSLGWDQRFRLGISKNVFAKRVIKHWTRLPMEMVESPSLEVFERRVDVAPRDRI